jgi:hypothetical protein
LISGLIEPVMRWRKKGGRTKIYIPVVIYGGNNQ